MTSCLRFAVLLALVILGRPEPSGAQESPGQTQVRTEASLMAPVSAVDPATTGLLTLGRGSRHFVAVGGRGDVFAARAGSGVGPIVGRAEIVSVDSGQSVARLLDIAGSQPALVTVGAQMDLTVLLPAEIHRGVIFELALNGIEFMDNDEVPLVSWDQLRSEIDDKTEGLVLRAMVRVGLEVVEHTKVLVKPLTRRPYQGKRITEIMQGATPLDYARFLRFVHAYPGKYIGRKWEISETFATWLLNNAPPAPVDMADDFATLDADALRTETAALDEREARSLAEYLRKRVDDIATSPGEVARRDAWFALLERVAKARGAKDPTVQAEFSASKASVLGRKRDHVGAARAYRDSARLRATLRQPLDVIVALNNAAGQLMTAERFKEADGVLAEARVVIAAERAHPTNPQVVAHLELREAFLASLAADAASRRGDYSAIVRSLEPTVAAFAKVGYAGARKAELELLARIASARAKLGEVDAALALYQRMEVLARDLGDHARIAGIAQSAGDAHWARSRWKEARPEFVRAAEIARASGLPAVEARALSSQGQVEWQLGDLDAAMACHGAAMTLRETLGDEDGIAWQLTQRADIHTQRGDRVAARSDLERALALRRKLDRAAGEIEVLLKLGDLELALSRADASETAYRSAGAIALSRGQVPEVAASHRGLAYVEVLRQRFEHSQREIEQAIALYRKVGDRLSAAHAELTLAQAHGELGRAAEAEAAYRRALDTDDRGVLAAGWSGLAGHALRLGRLDNAQAAIEKAAALAQDSDDVDARIGVRALRRTLAIAEGRFEDALAENDGILALARKAGNRPAEVDALLERAWTLADLGQLTAARAVAEEAAPLAEANGDAVQRAWALNVLARVAEDFGDLAANVRHLDAALVLMREAHFAYGIGVIRFNRALVDMQLRSFDAALAGFTDALSAVGTASSTPLELAVMSARTQALLELERLPEALDVATRALALSRSSRPADVPGLLVLQARTLAELGRRAEALATLDEAIVLQAGISPRLSGALARKGILLAEWGRHEEAGPVLATALSRFEAMGGLEPWEVLYRLGDSESRSGRRTEAIAFLTRAVAAIERPAAALHLAAPGGEGAAVETPATAEERYFADKLDVYRLLVTLLLGAKRVDEALIMLERSRSAELRSLDAGNAAGSRAESGLAVELDVQQSRLQRLLDKELARETPDPSRVHRLDGVLAGVTRRRAAFLESLDRNDALFDRYSVRPLHLEKLQAHLPDGVLVVSPVLLGDQVVVFALTRTILTTLTRPVAAGEVAGLVAALRRELRPERVDELGGGALVSVKKPAGQLFDILLRDVFAAVGVPKSLIVSATGALRYVPFGALWDGERWVAERSAVLNATALDREKFAASGNEGAKIETILTLADPGGDLADARTEVSLVNGLFRDSVLLEGAAATLDALRAKVRVPGFDVLHFATHGTLNAAHPEQSNIMLAGRALTYADIPTLALSKTRLVVLSACDTAVNTGGTGLEIAGMAYQFQRTQVDSVLATLWQVDDGATSGLIREFYKRAAEGERFADALAGAQRALIGGGDQELRHPAFWAPFVLMGTP